jgi:hypothetical protein
MSDVIRLGIWELDLEIILFLYVIHVWRYTFWYMRIGLKNIFPISFCQKSDHLSIKKKIFIFEDWLNL